MGAPSIDHEARVATLQAIATLAGFHQNASRELESLGHPDVMRLSPQCKGLFVGDGKATETPGNRATIARLSRYSELLVRWHAATGAPVILCVAFTHPSHSRAWEAAFQRLSVCQLPGRLSTESMDHNERVLAFVANAADFARGRTATRFLAGDFPA